MPLYFANNLTIMDSLFREAEAYSLCKEDRKKSTLKVFIALVLFGTPSPISGYKFYGMSKFI